jgi:hypothetical protein
MAYYPPAPGSHPGAAIDRSGAQANRYNRNRGHCRKSPATALGFSYAEKMRWINRNVNNYVRYPQAKCSSISKTGIYTPGGGYIPGNRKPEEP